MSKRHHTVGCADCSPTRIRQLGQTDKLTTTFNSSLLGGLIANVQLVNLRQTVLSIFWAFSLVLIFFSGLSVCKISSLSHGNERTRQIDRQTDSELMP